MYIVAPSERTSFEEAWNYSVNLTKMAEVAFRFQTELAKLKPPRRKRRFGRKEEQQTVVLSAEASLAIKDAQETMNEIVAFVYENEVDSSPTQMMQQFADGILADAELARYVDGYATFLQWALKQLIAGSSNDACVAMYSPALLWCFYASGCQRLEVTIHNGNPFKTQKKEKRSRQGWMIALGPDDE